MSIIKKPNFSEIFSSEAKPGEMQEFPDILRGWGITQEQTAGKPPMEWFNAIQKRADEAILYLAQQGISEWSQKIDYPRDAVVKLNGLFYVSIKENKSKNPETSQSDWKSLVDALSLKSATLTQKGIVKLNSAINSTSETMAATPKAVKEAYDAANSNLNGRLLNIQTFKSSGTYTPTKGTKKIHVKVWGAGGGGSNTKLANGGGFSGDGGGYAESLINVPSSSVSVIVGVGGASVPENTLAPGGNGGSSSFGNLIKSNGGNGGGNSSKSERGGQAVGGNIINTNGQAGQGSVSDNIAGTGGAAFCSFGGLPHSSTKGDDGGFPGGGGAGGNKIYSSGSGADGYVIVVEYT
jgi:phage-related tail fiber protein